MMLFFSERNFRGNHAGTKARNDAEKILRRFGAEPINTHVLELRSDENGTIRSNIKNRLGFVRFYMDLLFVRDQTIVIQYPMLAFDIQFTYIQKLVKHNRVVFLVHDIQSLRREGHYGLREEIRMLNMAYGLIVHNRFMEEKLRQLGVCVNRYYLLDCFDYLVDENTGMMAKTKGIVFAGNLGKSEFLPAMCAENPKLQFNFYGSGWVHDFSNVNYYGSFSPDKIPGRLEGKYGLIWDGNTIHGSTGVLGEYTRINNPHKLSLYIAAGIPVIAWEDAAIAELIHRHHIGITVNQLDSLQDIMNEISDEQYQCMKKNVIQLREAVISGQHLLRVLEAVERSQDG